MKIAYQHLVRLGEVNHARQFDSDIAHDVAEYRGVDALRLVQLVVAANVVGGADDGYRIAPGCGPRHRVVRHHQQHEIEQILVRGGTEIPVPDVVAIAGGGAGEIDLDPLGQQFVVGGIQRVGEAVQLAGLLEGCVQGELDDIEEHHRPALHVAEAVTPDQLLHGLQHIFLLGKRGIEFDEGGGYLEPLADLEQLLARFPPAAGNQFPDKGLVVIALRGAGARPGTVVAQEIVGHENDQQAALVRAPAKHDILAEPPLPAQGLLQRLEIASLDNADGVPRLAISRETVCHGGFRHFCARLYLPDRLAL